MRKENAVFRSTDGIQRGNKAASELMLGPQPPGIEYYGVLLLLLLLLRTSSVG